MNPTQNHMTAPIPETVLNAFRQGGRRSPLPEVVFETGGGEPTAEMVGFLERLAGQAEVLMPLMGAALYEFAFEDVDGLDLSEEEREVYEELQHEEDFYSLLDQLTIKVSVDAADGTLLAQLSYATVDIPHLRECGVCFTTDGVRVYEVE